MAKLKIAMYWAASCGGCEISLLEIHENVVALSEAADLVFCPCLVDTKYADVRPWGAAPFKDQAPYAVAIVEMDDGPRITTQVVDYRDDELQVGMPVKLEFRRVFAEGDAGVLQYGYKAVPA